METNDNGPSELDEESDAEIQRLWKAELRRRVEEIKSGKVKAVPIEEMFRRSRERYP